MKKTVDWNAAEKQAKRMSMDALVYARRDCMETARLWTDPATDPDGNGGFYSDMGSVYGREISRRQKAAA